MSRNLLSGGARVIAGAERIVLREDFASFVEETFKVVNPGVELVWAPYLELICARLGDVAAGRTRNLIICMPPRHLKSLCASVALPAFFLGHNPSGEVMAVSYGHDLAKTFAEDTRKVMMSDFYQRTFNTRLVNPRQSPQALETTDGGTRRATSIDGAATGIGADLLIFDDPQKPGEILSEAIRRSTNEAYERTFLTRRNDPRTSRIIIVMQRLHEEDFVGHVQGLGGDWETLVLPAIAEADEAIPYTTLAGPQTFTRKEGEALHPARVPLEEIARLRASMGEGPFAAQYQQRPAPAGGSLVKPEWFQRYGPGELPSFERVVQSWDTANKTEEWNDFSVCTTWGVAADGRAFLLNVYRKRHNYPELKQAVSAQAELYNPNVILIEDHASGTQLLQELGREGRLRVEGVTHTGDKRMRMSNQTAAIEAGRVYIPREAHWVEDYLHELEMFPNGRHDDQLDSTSQALGHIMHPHMKGYGMFELMRREAEALRGKPEAKPQYQPGSMEWAQEQARKALDRCK